MIELAKSFKQFIIESIGESEWTYVRQDMKNILSLPSEMPIVQKLNDLLELMTSLEENWDYSIRKSAYRLNIKIYSYPDLEKWAEAKGEDEEDLISDEIMYNDWARFMEDSFETSTESFKAEYDWIRDVEVDGRSGGWLLLTLNYSHSDLISDLAVYAGQPEEDLSDLSNPEILADLQRLSSDPDQLSELVEIGIIDEDAAESINDIIDDLAELEKEVDRHFERFNTVKEDLTKITKEIDDFKQNAVSYFYKWLSEGL